MLFCCYCLFGLFANSIKAQAYNSGQDLLQAMHTRYSKAPCACYTFSQKNAHYRNDSVVGTSEWHEEVSFPDGFKIAFGLASEQNYVQFKNDSAYRYRGGKLMNSRADTNNLLLILGGMYYRPFGDVVQRIKAAGYKLETLSESAFKGEMLYVIGAAASDSLSNQIWVDKKDLKVHRIIERMNASDIMDMRFETHQKWCRGFVETKVSFRRNGKLEQVEEYFDIKEKKCR